jgi:hypothetical protein
MTQETIIIEPLFGSGGHESSDDMRPAFLDERARHAMNVAIDMRLSTDHNSLVDAFVTENQQ